MLAIDAKYKVLVPLATSIRAPKRLLHIVLIAAISVSYQASSALEEFSDPLAAINRPVYSFNKAVDAIFLKPIAVLYRNVTPRFLKNAISNLFSNLDEVQVVANDLLQLDFAQAGRDGGRFAINSTLGVGGLFDVANEWFGIHKHNEGFGRTLAHWGVAPGPYLVLPVVGPSTLRESGDAFFEFLVDPLRDQDAALEDRSRSVSAIDSRASYLILDDLVSGDEYLFVRTMYMQLIEYRDSDQAVSNNLTDF